MKILLLFSFLAGLATILAPCIWPLLPIIFSASSGKGKRRPVGLTLGLMTSFSLFTLLISYLEKFLHINPNTFRLLAVVVIGFLGISMVIPWMGARFEVLIGRLLSPFQNAKQNQGTGFAGGYVAGFSIGLVWAPCAGPILATIATLAATQALNFRVVLTTLAYVLGIGIPLFFLSLGGSWCFAKMRQFSKYTGRVQQFFGVVMIAAALLIYTNEDKTIQLKILNAFPSYGHFFDQIENNQAVSQQLSALRGIKKSSAEVVRKPGEKLSDLGVAPEFKEISHWLNTQPLTLAQLRGKVVLVDFWTYSCINCLRTLPHVIAWYKKYGPQNFIVIGVHTPEFAFEKETANVKNALSQFKIHYPVAQDNDYQTWKAFNNEYWPAEYLIDAKGRIRLAHFGEGHYDQMEAAIRDLLAEAGHPVSDSTADDIKDSAPGYDTTPETYLGSNRIERFASPEKILGGVESFTLPKSIPVNDFAYQGSWNLSGESAKAKKGSALVLNFLADKVFLVMGPNKKGERVRLFMDGKPVTTNESGADVRGGTVFLDAHRLYRLIDLKGKIESHILKIEFENNGIAVYAFTFG